MKIVVALILGLGAIVPAIFGMALLFAFPIMWVWNAVIPDVFSLPMITIWQALGLNLLSGMLLRSNTSCNSCDGSKGGREGAATKGG